MTLLLVGITLSPVEQGFYFTFASILALQVFFELGLTGVISPFASHEKAFLWDTPNGALDGEPSAKARLASLLRLVLQWYGVLAVAVLVCVTAGGWWYFTTHASSDAGVSWQLPWIWLVVASAANLFISPIFAFLEGCGRLLDITKLRLWQVLFPNLLFWAALAAGWGLIAAPILSSGMFLFGAVSIVWRHAPLLADLLRVDHTATSIKWRTDILPLQWRIAVSWISGYFIFQLFNPVVFALHGPVAAGQFGMTLSLATAITTSAIAWINTKVPEMSGLIAQRQFGKLDTIFFPALWQSSFAAAAVAGAVWLCTVMLHQSAHPLAYRILGPWPTLFLLLTGIINHVVFCQALDLRAHLREPFLGLSLINGALSLVAIPTVARLGLGPIAVTYFTINLIVGLICGTFVFHKKRTAWHHQRGRLDASGPDLPTT